MSAQLVGGCSRIQLYSCTPCAVQVGFTMCVTGGRLAEELLELLPDYDLAFMGDEGPAAAAAAAGGRLLGLLAQFWLFGLACMRDEGPAAAAAAAGALAVAMRARHLLCSTRLLLCIRVCS